MRTKLLGLLALYLGVSVLLTGCWNSRELNDLAIVSGIGMDKLDDEEGYRVTFQIINPSSSAPTTGAASNRPPVMVVTEKDTTVFGALRKASRRTTRQLFFAHTQLLIIGEPLARSGVDHIFDIFERSHELRLNTTVLIAKNSDASSVLKLLTALESLPSTGLVKKTQNTARVWGENRKIGVFEIINGITSEGDFTINGIQIIGNAEEGMKKSSLEQTEPLAGSYMSGLGVFKKGKLISWLNGPESRGTQWLLNKLEETNVNIDASDRKEDISVNIFYSKTAVKVDLREGKPVFHIHIREEGSINEADSFVDFSKEEELGKLKKELAEQTASEVKMALKAAQEKKADIFNFGNELKRTHPELWKTVNKEWDSVFAEGELDLQVDAYIRGTGMRLKPYIPAEKRE
ncbi:Ger(x)C family spore germination protein [Paenibacillus tianjinensis]|uniref:Ger(X)C family spore germination protein n=1 Tax=Paenibacillus tianjinensis TaxID=2810347 RepID=A0ABX7LA60_9BACL|nr:Ger(x)C family spore germination protein [Paenibacillus tianjinensis]QSF43330.1 Ger(x)C family spore germination protein [Paenibacillus tianjinensis]